MCQIESTNQVSDSNLRTHNPKDIVEVGCVGPALHFTLKSEGKSQTPVVGVSDLDFEHQARQNLCTLNFSAAYSQVISECNLNMES